MWHLVHLAAHPLLPKFSHSAVSVAAVDDADADAVAVGLPNRAMAVPYSLPLAVMLLPVSTM